MQSNFIIINDAGLESMLVDHRIIESTLCVEDRQIENYYNVLKFSIDKNGRYTYESSVWGNETGHILQRKWAVFAWQQTGADGAAICPQKTFDSQVQAAVEFARWKRAEQWASDNRYTFENPFVGDESSEDQKDTLAALAGEFSDLVWWNYETGKKSKKAVPMISNTPQWVAEIWVAP